MPYGDVLGLQPRRSPRRRCQRATVPTAGDTSGSPATWHAADERRVPAADADPRRRARRHVSAPLRSRSSTAIGARASRRTVISGVQVGPSRRLDGSVGSMRPRGCVRSATSSTSANYVMLELNQPNHAYDLETRSAAVASAIRVAHDGEQMLTTLDGEDAGVHGRDDLLICDANDVSRSASVAIMGGLDTEITVTRRPPLSLEMAWFEPVGIVLQSVGPFSASARRRPQRFERGCRPVRDRRSPYPVSPNSSRETCPGPHRASKGYVDVRTRSRPAAHRCERPTVRAISEVNRILGTDMSADDRVRPTSTRSATRCAVRARCAASSIPSWRPDSTADEIDVIEEVARHYGYDRRRQDRAPKSVVHGELSTPSAAPSTRP